MRQLHSGIVRGQKFEGFGGAFTDSAGYVYFQMSEEQRQLMLHTYFDKSELNYRFGRIHLDSCDFSMEQYEALSDKDDKEARVECSKKNIKADGRNIFVCI